MALYMSGKAVKHCLPALAKTTAEPHETTQRALQHHEPENRLVTPRTDPTA